MREGFAGLGLAGAAGVGSVVRRVGTVLKNGEIVVENVFENRFDGVSGVSGVKIDGKVGYFNNSSKFLAEVVTSNGIQGIAEKISDN